MKESSKKFKLAATCLKLSYLLIHLSSMSQSFYRDRLTILKEVYMRGGRLYLDAYLNQNYVFLISVGTICHKYKTGVSEVRKLAQGMGKHENCFMMDYNLHKLSMTCRRFYCHFNIQSSSIFE
jgi:hypothetical protein